MKKLLTILSLALISVSAFAGPNDNASPRAFEAFAQAQDQAYTIPEPGTLALFAGAGIAVLALKMLQKK